MKPKKQAYLVGIKGVAMTALAIYLTEKGYEVTGSDVQDTFATDEILRTYNIAVNTGFSPAHLVKSYDVVVTTGAHGGMTNPEVQEAKRRNIRTFSHGEYVGTLMKEHVGLSVAGSHGKTTTSALLATFLTDAGYDPSYLVGTPSIHTLGHPGHYGKGKYLVVEADEYMTCPQTDPMPRFLWQHPEYIVATNIDYDHPDAFRSIHEVAQAFRKFFQNISANGTIVTCVDDARLAHIIARLPCKIITYGFSKQADYSIDAYQLGKGESSMSISKNGVGIGTFVTKLSGKHNLLNILGAAITAVLLGVDWKDIQRSLNQFSGTKRRFEHIDTIGTFSLYDDYAHHPREIVATVDAAKQFFPNRRIIVLFQPHTFSRTKAFLSDFSQAFSAASMAVIADIYPSARETIDKTVSSKMLVDMGGGAKQHMFYAPSKHDALLFLHNNLRPHDVIFTMGAGDINLWHHDIITLLKTVTQKQYG